MCCCLGWILGEKEKGVDAYMISMPKAKEHVNKKGVRDAVVAIYYILNTSTLGKVGASGSAGLKACENGFNSSFLLSNY